MNENIKIISNIIKSLIFLLAIFVTIKKQLDGLNFLDTFLFYTLPILITFSIILGLSYIKSQEIKIIGLITYIIDEPRVSHSPFEFLQATPEPFFTSAPSSYDSITTSSSHGSPQCVSGVQDQSK